MLQKLQIYYQPVQTNPDHLESFTVSYYDFDEGCKTYKEKIVLEKDGAKYKIKNVRDNLDEIKPFLESLDISKFNSTDVNPGDAYFYVKHGDRFIATSNAEDIRELLDWAGFVKIQGYGLEKYTKCD